MKMSLIKRLMNKITYNMITTCWIWTGSKVDNHKGLIYGQIWANGKKELVHRVSYQLFIGNIPKNLTIHHLCKNPLCVNPFHLKTMPLRENILIGNGATAINAKKTHCPKGHLLTGKRLYRGKAGRYCLQCNQAYNKQYRKNQKVLEEVK